MAAFEESFARVPVKRASEAQRRLWLLAAEGIRASKRDGVVRLLGNRYWADFLHGHMGQQLVVRFDPEDLHGGVHVYRLDGSYLGFAGCIEAVGFNDVEAAREHSRARRQWMKAQRAMLDAARKMTPADVADLIPPMTEAPTPEAKVVRLVTEPMAAPAPKPAAISEREAEVHERVIADLSDYRPAPAEETPADRYQRARDAEDALAAGREVPPEVAGWLGGYQQTAEYRSQRRLYEDFGGREETI